MKIGVKKYISNKKYIYKGTENRGLKKYISNKNIYKVTENKGWTKKYTKFPAVYLR